MPRQRRSEADIIQDFEPVRPRVLGALLTAVVAAVQNLPGLEPREWPRMADFAQWVTAAEPALGWADGTFLRVMERNAREAILALLDETPVVRELEILLDRVDSWRGTASELFDVLEEIRIKRGAQMGGWPRNPQALSSQLRRLQPNLRAIGIEIDRERTPDRARTRQLILRKVAEPTRQAS